MFELLPGRLADPVRASRPRLQPTPQPSRPGSPCPRAAPRASLLTHGNRHGGYAFYVADGRLHYVHNHLGLDRFTVSATTPLPAGDLELRMELGHHRRARLLARATAARPRCGCSSTTSWSGYGELPHTVPNLFGIVGLSCGYAAYDSVDPSAYLAPFTFTGTIHGVMLDVTGESLVHPEAEMTRMMTPAIRSLNSRILPAGQSKARRCEFHPVGSRLIRRLPEVARCASTSSCCSSCSRCVAGCSSTTDTTTDRTPAVARRPRRPAVVGTRRPPRARSPCRPRRR